MLRKIIAATVAALLTATTLILPTSAIEYSGSNIDIPITAGAYTGYRFFGPDSPHSHIDTSQIAYVKFYIKFPDLQYHEPANVVLAYNSGTTGWVSRTHDLNDGLIVQIELSTGGIVAGDFFDAALSTDDYEIHGTYSVEVLDWNGAVLGEGVYSSNIFVPEDEVIDEGEWTEDETPDEVGNDEPEELPEEEDGYSYEEVEGDEVDGENPNGVGESRDNPQTDAGANILTATGMSIVSALAILSMTKKAKQERRK